MISGGHKELLVKQLDEIIEEYQILLSRYKFNDLSDAPEYKIQDILTRSTSAIYRISGKESSYSLQLQDINERHQYDHFRHGPTIGVVMALKSDIESGYLQNFEQLIHAEVFSDFIQMAEHLLHKGYKDPSGVIAGSALEAHLRQLSKLFSIPVEFNKDGISRPKKADRLNSDLAKSGAYSVLDQKNVTAWLDLRNKASHGKYDEYSSEQVNLMISSIKEFMIRNPA